MTLIKNQVPRAILVLSEKWNDLKRPVVNRAVKLPILVNLAHGAHNLQFMIWKRSNKVYLSSHEGFVSI